MPKTRYQAVVVFGDSLSDIGIKAFKPMGRIARQMGEMTVNPSGRFSDCRNWADHMYTSATGETLVHGDVKLTKAQSRKHTSFGADAKWEGRNGTGFYYANYAEGGACGGIPTTFVMRHLALGQFKDQVKAFAKDVKKPGWTATDFLFIIWFGANDLYTAGAPATAMGGVAKKIAEKRRDEIRALIGNRNARFVFVNLGAPLSATRYQLVEDKRQRKFDAASGKILSGAGKKKDLKEVEKFHAARKMINNFDSGVNLFNAQLSESTAQNGDIYIDMAACITREAVNDLLGAMRLLPGSQEKGSSKRNYSSLEYDQMDSMYHTSTSDDAHPTDRIYKYMWDQMAAKLGQENITFGLLPA